MILVRVKKLLGTKIYTNYMNATKKSQLKDSRTYLVFSLIFRLMIIFKMFIYLCIKDVKNGYNQKNKTQTHYLWHFY